MRLKLTGKRVQDLKAPAKGQPDLYVWDAGDGAIKGLFLRLKPSRKRSWGFQHTAAGKRTRLILGDASTIGLGDARKLARKKITKAADGVDLKAERKVHKTASARVVSKVLDAYELDMRARQCSPNHVRNTRSVLERGLAKLLKRDLAALTREDFVRLIEAVRSDGARQSLRQRVTPFLNYAVNAGLIPHNVMAGWKRPRASKAERQERAGRILTADEIRRVWTAASKGSTYGAMVRVMLLTGLRIGTTAQLQRNWIDEAKGALEIPPHAMKSGRAFAVPLTAELRHILDAQPRWATTDLIFPTRSRDGKAVRIASAGKMQPRLLKASATSGWSPHDCRRTFRSMMSDLGFDDDLSERALAHARDSLIERYDRSTRWPDRVTAAEAIERRVLAIARGKDINVVPLVKIA
jgi:integrase